MSGGQNCKMNDHKVLSIPFYTQPDRRHETTTNRKSVKNWYVEYIVSRPTAIF